MMVQTGSITVATLCEDLRTKHIKINKEYQRSPRVWSTAARSYLLETILKGYPIPKVYLWQNTDLRSMRTELEIVDGQQRCMAIQAFARDELVITSKGDYRGLRYSDLAEEDQQRFVEYAVGTDTLVGATKQQVREVYRRINSFTTPLNAQEKRFAAAFGGEGSVKYFILEAGENYSEVLIQAGALTPNNVNRMGDQEFIAMLVNMFRLGIHTSAPAKLNKLYSEFDDGFPIADECGRRLMALFDWVARSADLHGLKVFGREQLLSLGVAYSHAWMTLPSLVAQGFHECHLRDEVEIIMRLQRLEGTLEMDVAEVPVGRMRDFAVASSSGTNTIKNRTVRVREYLDAVSFEQ